MIKRLKSALVASAVLVLSACATNVTERQALPDEQVRVADVSVEGSLRSNATSMQISAVDNAMRQEIAARNVKSGKPVDLKLIITRAEFVAQETRALVGAFAGSNHLDITVYLLEPGTNVATGEFDVKVDNNPGGFGMFSDPVTSASEDAAAAIANKILPQGS